MVTAGTVFFYLKGQTCNFYADSVRVYIFQQLLCRTFALTPSGSKVMFSAPSIKAMGKNPLRNLPKCNYALNNFVIEPMDIQLGLP